MGRAVVIDNRSENDNWITNKSGVPVTVACKELFGSFAVNMQPGERRRVTWNVQANAYPYGNYSYDNLKFSLGEGEQWEIHKEAGAFTMRMVGHTSSQPLEVEGKPKWRGACFSFLFGLLFLCAGIFNSQDELFDRILLSVFGLLLVALGVYLLKRIICARSHLKTVDSK